MTLLGIEDYHNLIEVTKDVFPNAYITICGLLPKISNSHIEHYIIQLSADLKHLCKDCRYVKYVDMISHFTTYNGLINLKYCKGILALFLHQFHQL